MTTDDYAFVPGNLRRLSGVLGEPRIIHDFWAGSITESLQYYNSLFINLHQSEIVEVLQYLVTNSWFKSYKLSMIIITNHSSGVA